MTSHLTPTQVEPFSPTELRVKWSDGSDYIVPYVEVRYLCPCAGCVDEHTGQRMIQRASVSPTIRPTGVVPVGRYALQFNWTDGHSSGIYHFDTLLEICRTQGKKQN